MAKTVGTRNLKISELYAVQRNIAGLMYCEKLGLDKSLLLHRNNKMSTKILEDKYNEPLKVIQKVCCEMDGGDNPKTNEKTGELIYKSTEAEAEYKKKVKDLWNESVDIYFEPLKLSDIPSSLGNYLSPDGKEIPFFEYLPPLYDHVLVSDEEFNKRSSEEAKKGIPQEQHQTV